MPLKRNLTAALDLPKEVVLSLPLMTLTGKEELYIENYKGVLEYTEEAVRIHTGAGLVRVAGKNLVLKAITNEGVLITGGIQKVEFLT